MRKSPPNKTKNKAKSLARRERAMAGRPEAAERVTRDGSAPNPSAKAGRMTAGEPHMTRGGEVPTRYKGRSTLHRRDLK